MSTYKQHPESDDLYIWNTRVSKTYLEDVQHLEVLLRNFIHDSLSNHYGDRWFVNNGNIPFDHHALKSIDKARRRVHDTVTSPAPSGKVIAELSFDFWRFLLTSRYQTTIWPKLLKNLCTTASRQAFERQVVIVYDFRNRAAHHEPVIKTIRSSEEAYLSSVSIAILKVAEWIDPEAATWIAQHSRVPQIRAERP